MGTFFRSPITTCREEFSWDCFHIGGMGKPYSTSKGIVLYIECPQKFRTFRYPSCSSRTTSTVSYEVILSLLTVIFTQVVLFLIVSTFRSLDATSEDKSIQVSIATRRKRSRVTQGSTSPTYLLRMARNLRLPDIRILSKLVRVPSTP